MRIIWSNSYLWIRHRQGFLNPRICCALGLLLAVQCSAVEASTRFELGNEAYADGLYADAARLWMRSAEDDDALSQYNLAILHEHGKGVEQSFARATYWYRKAADAGISDAQFSLANILILGPGDVPKRVREAIEWYLHAADNGHADAQYKLATLLLAGEDVPPDPETAKRWLELAADNGHHEAGSLLYSINNESADEVSDERWLLGQPARAWTVEMYSALDKNSAGEFIRRTGLEGAAIIETDTGRFLVLAGVFETEEFAAMAINGLVPQLRARFPQPRQFSDLHGFLSIATVENIAGKTEPVQPVQEAYMGANVQIDFPSDLLDVHWLEQQSPDAFSVLLYSSADVARAVEYIQLIGLENAVLLQTQHDGLFNVLTGTFTDSQSAQQAIDALPKQLRDLGARTIMLSEIKVSHWTPFSDEADQ